MRIDLVVLCLIVKFAVNYAKKGFGSGEQDWGYVNVRPGAQMFWWLYETTANVVSPVERPLVIWLQGGPGASSTGFGNFAEIGPLDIDLNERNHTWVKNYNVLFIDNPVGTGFSYVSNLSALTTKNKQIAQDLVVCVDGFLQKHDEFKFVPIYVAAESYGGKMAVEFVLELYKRVKAGNNEANIRGVSLIDSWISPVDSVLNWAPYLLNIGAVDKKGYNQVYISAQLVKNAIDVGNYELATQLWGATENVIAKVAHRIDFYNVLQKVHAQLAKNSDILEIAKPGAEAKSLEDAKLDRLMNGEVRKSLGLEVGWGAQHDAVFSTLRGDFMRPVTQLVEEILNRTDIKVQVVTGQLDLIVDTPGTVQWVDRLRFPKSKEGISWTEAPRNTLEANGFIEGYYKTLGRFGLYWVNRAGHMVPADNPEAMNAILERLVNNK